MKMTTKKRGLIVAAVVISLCSAGCTRILGIAKNEYRGGDYFPTCLVKADQALAEARAAGKDKACPDEYNALKAYVDEAYKVHFGCNTDGACKMARDAIARAGALTCQPKPVAQPAPEPPPVIPAPSATIAVDPSSVTQGTPAKLTWSSQNATNCTIEPGIGPVEPQGSRDITPSADTAYSIVCSGKGGTARSATNVAVVIPPPPVPVPKAAPAPEPVPEPAPKPEQLCVTLNVEFATAKADIPAKYHDELAKVAKLMKEYPQLKGVIEGHTDNRGGKSYNEKLSERRAQSVKDYLVKKFGIDASRLGVKGYGFSKPIASNATEEGRQDNRRIVANFGCVEKK